MSSGGFANADLIMNLKKNVLDFLKNSRGIKASWVFDSPVSNETPSDLLLNWSSTLTIKGKVSTVVFIKQGDSGSLFVLVNGSRISVGRHASFGKDFLKKFWHYLEGNK